MTEFVSESPTTFVLSGGREVVNEERAKELIAIANITDHDAITKVVLSNKSITEKAAEVFSSELKKFKNVTVVDISDIIAGRPEDEALNTLKWICEEGLSHCQQNIIEVNVSDNALGVKGINVIKSILVGKKLENVYFCNNGMSAEAAALICELLLQSTDDNNEEIEKSNEKQSPPPLKILHFFNNMSGNGGGVAIAKLITACSKTLTNIRFSATRCMASGCQNIVEVSIFVYFVQCVFLSVLTYMYICIGFVCITSGSIDTS